MPKSLNFGLKQSFLQKKYIEIRKSFIEYCSPLEPTKAFACISVDLIWTIYQSGVLALGGERYLGAQKPEPSLVKMV